ncbi:MAG: hypothetical protein KGV57_01970 [Fusobacterium sp.]|nr:hypothetical protein [Fusobacterium sp.]
MKKIVFILSLIFSMNLFSWQIKENDYQEYYNSKIGYVVDYPTKYFEFLAHSKNGREMQTENGKVYVSFYGRSNDYDGPTIEDKYREELERLGDVSYKFLGQDTYSISYTRNGKIYFKKVACNRNNTTYVTLYFVYDKKYKKFMNSVIKRMVDSLVIECCCIDCKILLY